MLVRRIARLVEAATQAKGRYVTLADKAAKLYSPVVHIVAFSAFLSWMWATGDFRTSLNIAIATLIITCPCALGLAVPAVLTAASGRLFRMGLLMKDGAALERLAGVDTAVFDKTGTLTSGKPVLLGEVSRGTLALAAGLAMHSAHPLSKAVVAAAKGLPAAPVTDVVEFPGQGIEGRWQGRRVRLGGPISWAPRRARDVGLAGCGAWRAGRNCALPTPRAKGLPRRWPTCGVWGCGRCCCRATRRGRSRRWRRRLAWTTHRRACRRRARPRGWRRPARRAITR